MYMETETIVKSGKYKFRIVDKITKYEERIIGRNLKIGGNYADCVNISISYSGDTPISAYIPILVYDEECSIETPLDRGGGSVVMIKELLIYVKQKIPEITSVNCENAYDIYKYLGTKKKGTQIKPIPLYFFSILFNGKTWYEKHFNARLKQDRAHKAYRSKVEQMLTMQKPSFDIFLQIINPPLKNIPELKKYYETHNTYGDFFHAIPIQDRCELVRDWITTFMQYYIGDVFSNNNWLIPINSFVGGSKQTKKNKSKYRIIRYTTSSDIGVSVRDV